MAKEQITIAGQAFLVPNPYEVGHVVTAGEADALNQTFHENVRNNLATKIKEGVEAGKSAEDLQALVNEYSEKYEFGVRTGGGGRSSDPVRSRAMDIARDKVKGALQKKGEKISNYSAKQISEAASNALDKHPEWTELAKRQIEAEQALAAETLDDVIAGIGEPNLPAEETQPAA